LSLKPNSHTQVELVQIPDTQGISNFLSRWEINLLSPKLFCLAKKERLPITFLSLVHFITFSPTQFFSQEQMPLLLVLLEAMVAKKEKHK